MSQSSYRSPIARTSAAVSIAGLVMLTACMGGGDDGAVDAKPATTSGTTSAGSTSSGLPVTRARHVRVYDANFAGSLAVQHRPDRLWSGSTTNLGWLDPRTGATHVVDAVPGVMVGIYHDTLYRTALYGNNVARYDVSGTPLEVARQPAPSPLNILAGPPGVWVADHFHGNLLRLDRDTMKVIRKIPIGSGHGNGPSGMLRQGKNMWVNVQRDQTIALVDGRTGRVLHRVYLGGTNLGDGISRTSAGIWAKSFHGDRAETIALIDPQRFRVIARFQDPGQTFPELAAGADGSGAPPVEINGETWMLDGDKLWHLSPEHNWQPDRAVDLHMPHLFAGFDLVAFGALWISNFHPEQLIRVGAQDLR
jgi:DNA-binding beta-propeller fold protein YncE